MAGVLNRLLARASGVPLATATSASPARSLPAPTLPYAAARPRDYVWEADAPLLQLSAGDAWRVKDAFEGTQILGSPGSGKTSGSGKAIAHAFLSAGFGGLVLCAKVDERARWERYCAETGRTDSLIVFDDSGSRRLNFLHYEMARQGLGRADPSDVVALLLTLLDATQQQGSQYQRDSFWRDATGELLSNAIALLWSAYGRLEMDQLFRLIRDRPTSGAQAKDTAWRADSFWAKTIDRCAGEPSHPLPPEDLEAIRDYWETVLAQKDERTAGNIIATLSAQLHRFRTGILRQLFCTTTNVLPELTHEGAVLVIDLPVKEGSAAFRMAQHIFKYLWQRSVERRPPDRTSRPVFLWADECQFFVSPYDNHFQSTARSARACTVFLTQSLPAYYEQIGAQKPEHATDSLLANFQTKIFHASSCPKTNQWAADLIGKSIQRRRNWGRGSSDGSTVGSSYGATTGESSSVARGTSTNRGQSRGWGHGWSGGFKNYNTNFNFGETRGDGASETLTEGTSSGENWSRNRSRTESVSTNAGITEVIDYQVQPAAFTTLRKGDRENGYQVDGLVFQGGRVWRHSGSTWLPCAFSQV